MPSSNRTRGDWRCRWAGREREGVEMSDKRELSDEGHTHTLWEPAVAYAVYVDEQDTGLICGLQNVYYRLE